MRLINTHTFKLQFFVSPDSKEVKGGYAILSHVWDEHEQTFQDLEIIHNACTALGKHPRDLVSQKIRRACELAASQGYEWLWIDTCCIDKTSSAELSEAINSMYRYYSLAEVCYAYLKDVPTEESTKDESMEAESTETESTESSTFEESSWHTRGWTLQELIAPRVVLFLSESWNVIGTKSSLAAQLHKATCIPESVLQLSQSPAEVSIAQRMSWAAYRKTTRVEDKAYSLLGIFDINMPTLYGEGSKAFRRLQEEILRKYDDTTLFAWTETPWDYARRLVRSGLVTDARGSVFASSPSAFCESRDIEYCPKARHCAGEQLGVCIYSIH